MKALRIPAYFTATSVWVISILVFWNSPVVGDSRATERPTKGNPGIAWLALPAEIPDAPDPLGGWKRLSATPLADTSPLQEEQVTVVDPVLKGREEVVSSMPSWQLLGRIVEGGREVYCLFDTFRKVWVRLAVGETDREAGLRLLRLKEGNSLQLKDLKSGINYVIHPSEWSLAPLAKSE